MGYFNDKLIPVISNFQEKFSDHDMSSIITPLQDECTLENSPNVLLRLLQLTSTIQREKFSDHDLSSIITPLQEECTLENLPNVFLRLLQFIEFLLDRTQSPLKCQLQDRNETIQGETQIVNYGLALTNVSTQGHRDNSSHKKQT